MIIIAESEYEFDETFIEKGVFSKAGFGTIFIRSEIKKTKWKVHLKIFMEWLIS